MRQLQSSDARPSTLRSYAYDVQRWLRFLRSINVEFDEASPVDYYDFRTFLRRHGKDHGARRSRGPQFAQRNLTTGKVHADNTEFGLATLQHSRTVLHEWYEFLYDVTGAPLANPIPHSYRRERGHQRIHEHHNPMQDFTAHRTRLREGGRRVPTTQPRSMTNDAFDDFWKAVTCHRDRALVKVHVDTAIRPQSCWLSPLVMWTGVDRRSPSPGRAHGHARFSPYHPKHWTGLGGTSWRRTTPRDLTSHSG